MKQFWAKFWRENKYFLIFLGLMFMFRSACADWNTVPTASMKPTILEGDRIAVNKLAYDLHIPFTHISLVRFADPQRGDIAVFDSKVSDKRLVKRVIGVPGDTVTLINNELTINGTALQYEKTANNTDQIEHLFNTPHIVRINNPENHPFANFPTVIVPAGHYLMMGDNRDLSADSRVIGFVPRDEFVGRSRSVIMSLNYDNFYLPRLDRFFKSL
ncbi:signal peptidase I [Cellvibrio zantedeschiae]|uniref:Signal peptidase I n=1 Tax=Cellvibrio zantedeschiae TaxID=1237077 RepID=A0ABQ3AQV5_9GAMM|nr:signal peptidase I [Cellvibrio zantedeschiae]GGY65007.1 signal peptidase I [Cellvibrio zantedeschiae]